MSYIRLSDEDVELEIQRLSNSPMVKLAQREIRVRNRRRQYMYNLRALEKRGIALTDSGVTLEMLYNMDRDMNLCEEMIR